MPAFDWSFPYPSQRMPIFARQAVATSQPLAAQAGLDILKQGGNAIDAAIATAITLTVVEPTSNGIGSDAFALIWAGGGLHGLNASGRSPRTLDPQPYLTSGEIPQTGWHGVTTPGAVSAWVACWKKFGSLPFQKLFEPAISNARSGFLVSPQTAYYWRLGANRYSEMGAWMKTFAPDGRAPGVGELFRSEDHAKTLEAIAETKGEAFYHGELADRIDTAAREGGGALRKEDLAAHQAEWVRPLSADYHGYELHEIPPNGQGMIALIALGILKQVPGVVDLDPDSPESLHVQIEAMKLAFRDGHRYISDPRTMDAQPAALLDEDYLKSRAQLIDRSTAQDFGHGAPKPGGTVYLTAADNDGNMVSYIQSNYTGFGSGIVVPGTGIALQNRGCCFTTEPGHPNVIAPNKRPYHTIIPGFVLRDGKPLMSFGVMGGYMQPQGHAQVVLRMADHRQNPQSALDAPRWQITEGLKVIVEPGFDERVYTMLSNMGHDLTIARARTVSHGRGQIIYRLDDGYCAASDARSDGQAVGF